MAKNAFFTALILGALFVNPGLILAKNSDGQYQIILLNDAASALEEQNPALSKSLTRAADQKEKEWEIKNASKGTALVAPLTKKDLPQLQSQLEIFTRAALAVKSDYPLIASGLEKMVKDLKRSMDHVKE